MITVTGCTITGPFGRQGNQYFIPSKRVPVEMIRYFVQTFFMYARAHPGEHFQVTPLAGHKHAVIAPLFDHPPANVFLPYEFQY